MPVLDAIVPALLKTAKAYETREKSMYAAFTLSYALENDRIAWEAKITTGVPETCAGRNFVGTGISVRSALAELSMRVIMEQPEAGSLG